MGMDTRPDAFMVARPMRQLALWTMMMLAACSRPSSPTTPEPPAAPGRVTAPDREAQGRAATPVAGPTPAAAPGAAPVGTSCVHAGDAITSTFTDLSDAACVLVSKDPETGGTTSRCPGIGKMTLLVHDDDDRMSITVVTADGKHHPLQYWNVITPAFSELGPKAEWRVVRRGGTVIPIALVARVNSQHQTGGTGPPVQSSSLAVAKITDDVICVTDNIASGARANESAQRAADTSCLRPCLPF
jgi:hypothetical protein